MNKKRMGSFIILCTLFLAVVFIGTYIGVSRYIESRNEKKQAKLEEEILLNQNTKTLKDSLILIFKENDEIEKSLKLKELKKEKDITGDLNREELLSVLENDNYLLEKEGEGQMVFNRTEDKKLIPNNYYIGEKDGYFAIYKVDNSGNIAIEDSKEDIFRDFKMVKELNDLDRDRIVNLEFTFTNKEDAQEKLSEFLS